MRPSRGRRAIPEAILLPLATLVSLAPRPRSRGRKSLIVLAILVLIAGGLIRLHPHASLTGGTATIPGIDPEKSPVVPGVARSGGQLSSLSSPTATLLPLSPARVAGANGAAPLPPNELGLVPILMYHTFLPNSSSKWNRTPAQFRGDLEYLYAHDYYLTTMHQFVTGDLDIPAGKSPVILTFDDGAESQFRYLVHPDGSTTIDPDSAVGIIEAMYARHPDFGRAGVFYVLPLLPFGNDNDEHDQRRFAREKLNFLVEHGYELGNHTLHHANLGTLSDEQVRQEIAGGDDGIHSYVPGATIETIALPFGIYPNQGDPRLLQSCTYNGKTYHYRAAMMVGAEAAPAPVDRRRNLLLTPRIRATDNQLGRWFGNYLDQYPTVRYVSDGDPRKVTIPRTLPPSLRDKLDETKLGGRTLVRYGQ